MHRSLHRKTLQRTIDLVQEIKERGQNRGIKGRIEKKGAWGIITPEMSRNHNGTSELENHLCLYPPLLLLQFTVEKKNKGQMPINLNLQMAID